MNFSGLIDQALSRTYHLLWERRSFRRWWNFGFLTLLTQLSGSVGVPAPPAPADRGSSLRGVVLATAVGAGGLGFDSAALVLLGAGMLLGLVFLWVSSVARLALIDNIMRDREDVSAPLRRFSVPGLSVFAWTLAVFFVGFTAMMFGVVGLALALQPALDPEALDPTALLGVLFPVLLLVVAGVMAISLLTCLNFELALPLMVLDGRGELGAWGVLLRLMGQRPSAWLLYVLVRFVLAMAAGAMGLLVLSLGTLAEVLVVGVLVGLPGLVLVSTLPGTAGPAAAGAAFVLGASLLLVLFLPLAIAVAVPVTVFGQCFAMYALQEQSPELRLIPLDYTPGAPSQPLV
ncbi:MAG: hypothetical protein HY319_02330 [Armatimonadetes bacterium]|nr:hypothetical protein [Armatimonadota bacterium]